MKVCVHNRLCCVTESDPLRLTMYLLIIWLQDVRARRTCDGNTVNIISSSRRKKKCHMTFSEGFRFSS